MSQLLMIALAVCFCSAAPTTELVVPEYLDFTAASKLAPTAFLQAVIKSGGTKGDCRTFATTTISDIETAVSSQQGVLNAIDNGDGCAAMGQTLVTSTKAAVVSAQAVVVTKQSEASAALAAKNTACSAGVDFSVGLETLEANSCYDYTSQTGYTQAKAACVAATSALATADAAVVTAQTVVTDAQATAADAVAEAARLESGCLCRVHQEQAAAQVAVQAATATNAADWKQAHEVLCAVEQTAPCPVPSCPTVEQPKLADGVDNADTQHCTAAPTAEPTMSPTAEPTAEPLAYHKVFDGDCHGAEKVKYYRYWQKNPGTTVAERVKYCAEACDGFNVPKQHGYNGPGGVAKGFIVTPNEGVCLCEPQDSSTCTRAMDPTRDAANTGYDRYDFGEPAVSWVERGGKTTWAQAQAECGTRSRELCAMSEVCPGGPTTQMVGHAYGIGWFPVADGTADNNNWAVGFDGHQSTVPSCELHQLTPQYRGRPKPSWGLVGGWQDTKIPCCK